MRSLPIGPWAGLGVLAAWAALALGPEASGSIRGPSQVLSRRPRHLRHAPAGTFPHSRRARLARLLGGSLNHPQWTWTVSTEVNPRQLGSDERGKRITYDVVRRGCREGMENHPGTS